MSSPTIPLKYAKPRDYRQARGGISHSYFYRLAGEGKIRLVKLGTRTLVDVKFSDRYFDSLPEATIKLDKRTSTVEPATAA
jgi:hypothetical protein